MCGIVGFIGNKDASPIIFKSLKSQDYRGYDSFGIVTWTNQPHLYKSIDRIPLKPSKKILQELPGNIGIGHSRWATSGEPIIENAHPIVYNDVHVVHNGIIDNSQDFTSGSVDSEAIAVIIDQVGNAPLSKLHEQLFSRLHGSWAFLALVDGQIYGSTNQLPLLISECGSYLVSDVVGFPREVKKYRRLPDKVVFSLGRYYGLYTGTEYRSFQELPLLSKGKTFNCSKERCKHFMMAEIKQQASLFYDYKSPVDMSYYEEIFLFGAGSSYYAGMFGELLLEKFANVQCTTNYATRVGDKNRHYNDRRLHIAISQSGETLDTLTANRLIRSEHTLCITNNVHSTLAMESPYKIDLVVGQEVAVGATKSFTAQVLALFSLCDSWYAKTVEEFKKSCKEVLSRSEEIRRIAGMISEYHNIFVLGRGLNYPVALESSLKLKEISYRFAEGLLSSEVRHGPISMVSPELLCIFLVNNEDNEKVLENMSEIYARKGNILTICQERHRDLVQEYSKWIITIPDLTEYPSFGKYYEVVQSLSANVVMQLLAYYLALQDGLPIDRPRHLAKTICV